MRTAPDPSYHVRLARADELEPAIEVWRAANPGKVGGDHPDRLAQWHRSPGARLTVVNLGHAIVSMALGLPGRSQRGAGDLVLGLLHVTGVCVHPDHRRRGVGHLVLGHVLADGLTLGYTDATLWTNTSNVAARRLFEDHGFVPTGEEDVDEFGEAMILMRSALSARE